MLDSVSSPSMELDTVTSTRKKDKIKILLLTISNRLYFRATKLYW